MHADSSGAAAVVSKAGFLKFLMIAASRKIQTLNVWISMVTEDNIGRQKVVVELWEGLISPCGT